MLVELPNSFLALEKDFAESLRHIAITDLCCLFRKLNASQKTSFSSLLKNHTQTLQQLLTDPITNEIITSAVFITNENHPPSFDEDDWRESFNQLYTQSPPNYGEYYDVTSAYYWLINGASPLTRIKKKRLFSSTVLDDFINWCIANKLIKKESEVDLQDIDVQFSSLIKNEINITDMPVYNFHQADLLLRLAYLYGEGTTKVKNWIHQAIKDLHSENSLLLLFKSAFDHQSITTPILCKSNNEVEKKIIIDQRNLKSIDTNRYTQIQTPLLLDDLFVFTNMLEACELNASNLTAWLNKWFHDDDFRNFFIEKLKLALLYSEPTLLRTWKVPKYFHCADCDRQYTTTMFYAENNIIDIFLKLYQNTDTDEILLKAVKRLNADQIIAVMSNYSKQSKKNTFYTCIQYNCIKSVETIFKKINGHIIDLIRPVYKEATLYRNSLLFACNNNHLNKKLSAIIAIIEIFHIYLNPPFLSWLARAAMTQHMQSAFQEIKHYLESPDKSMPQLSHSYFIKQTTLLSDSIKENIWPKKALLEMFDREGLYHLRHSETINPEKISFINKLIPQKKYIELKTFC